MTQSSDGSTERHSLTLSAADAAALDAVMQARGGGSIRLHNGDAAAGTVAVDPPRRERVQGWLNVVGAAAVPPMPADLLERTLAAVDLERMKLRAGSNAAAPAPHPVEKPRRKWSHFGEVAAMLVAAILLVAVLVPAIGQARQSYRRTLCATNLAAVGTAFGLYGSDNNNQLPCLAMPADHNWLRPDATGHTNTANLLPLLNASYLPPTRLVCAGRGLPENATATATPKDIQNCGYSYVNMFGASKPTWDHRAGTIVLGDRNPLFTRPAANSPDDNSFNHGQKGTYLLRADGHVTWETSPNVGNDNIWTVGLGSNRVVFYTGTEVPEGAGDTFLSP